MKFVRRSRGLLWTLLLLVGGELGLLTAHHSLKIPGLSTALGVATTVLGIAVYVTLHLAWMRIRKPETLEIGRRGLMITQPGIVPYALAWRMIREATFEPGDPQRWRFTLKNGVETTLQEGDFSREQWKKFSSGLERKLRAKKIAVKVATTRTP